jgi:hypothetical protein
MLSKRYPRRESLAFMGAVLLTGLGLASTQSHALLRVIFPVGAGSGVDVIVRSAEKCA